jgi:hypothetical protein
VRRVAAAASVGDLHQSYYYFALPVRVLTPSTQTANYLYQCNMQAAWRA